MRSKYGNPSSPTSFRPLPDPATRQQLLKAKRLRTGLFSVGAIALVAFSMVWNPPTGRVHSFTQASDYNPVKESGCTNSGEGCHGEETEYRDFNAYHPNSDCTSCHDYQGVGCIPCHSPDGHECQTCHDGTMEAAGDRLKLSDPWPRGHYRETTHTVTGTDLTEIMRAAEDGAAQANCRACHARDLYTAHKDVPAVEGSAYGTTVGCGECHNDTRSAGLAQVKSKWKRRRCEDCHGAETSSPMHDPAVAPSAEPSSTGAGCDRTGEGCHDVRDLHALHPNAPEDCSGSATSGEPGCHDLGLQAHVPTATACGAGTDDACHAPYENDELSHENDQGVHSPGGVVAVDESFFGVACGRCHDMRDDGVSLISEHALPTSAQSDGGPCGGCHNHSASVETIAEDWPERDEPAACESCHGSHGLDAVHTALETGRHLADDSGGCSQSGIGCHPTADLSSVKTTDGDDGLHDTCLRCHDRTRSDGNLAYNPAASSCGANRACHNRDGFYARARPIHQDAAGMPVDGTDRRHTATLDQAEAQSTDIASGVTSYCSDCHGMVLGTEHARPNSALVDFQPNVCAGCHNASDETAAVVKDGWPSRTSPWACEACHGFENVAHENIDTAHAAVTLDATGTPTISACASADCHETVDLRVLHSRTGCTTLGCHQPDGDIRGLAVTTCGGPDTGVACHTRMHAGVDGYDTLHLAGDAQRDESMEDTASGLFPTCAECHTMLITTEHERPNSSLVEGDGSVCLKCHTANPNVIGIVDGDWAARDTSLACLACHTIADDMTPHTRVNDVHFAREYTDDGTAVTGACATTGCHPTTDVRIIHREAGCTIHRCHAATSDIRGANNLRCGGSDADTTCHRSFSIAYHRQSHSADLTGTVEDITYRAGENVGCFGCHSSDLALEHSDQLINGSMDGGGASPCRVCHFNELDSGNGDYSDAEAVTLAIENSDRRCIACHRSGSDGDTTATVASPHKAISTDETLPAGRVWSDPLDDWREALDAPTGGGHNVLPADVVGAAQDKAFPLTSFDINGETYPWTLPRNTGSSAWLRTTELTPVFPTEGPADPLLFPSAVTTEGIQALMVTCGDCHEMADPTGPQGAAVEISIDPDYAQTEWSNPTTGTYQFDPYNVDIRNGNNPDGYKPVICVKCHLVYARALEGTTTVAVGGTSYHSTHASRHGEVCIDCHVRIPHAWKRPRLLPRTVATEGEPADTFPYVREDHDGLTGIALTVTTLSNPVARDTCATGGCYSSYYLSIGQVRQESATSHPIAERDLPGDQAFWP